MCNYDNQSFFAQTDSTRIAVRAALLLRRFVLLVTAVVCGVPILPAFAEESSVRHSSSQYLPVRREIWFEHLSLAEGLSQSSIYAMTQDHYGFLWIGTEDGLNRYDGYRFTHYRHNPADTRSLSVNNVTALYEDHSGTLWVGLGTGGVNAFDRKSESFTRYEANPANPQTLSSNQIRGIVEDRLGTLWVATANGLNGLDKRTGKWRHIMADAQNTASQQHLSSNALTAILLDREGMIWVGTWGGGVNRVDPKSGTVTCFDTETSGNNLIGDFVTALREDLDGDIWVGTTKGASILRFRAGKSQHFRHYEGRENQGLSGNLVRAFWQENDSTMWIGAEFGGLTLLNKHTERSVFYRHEPTNALSLSNDNIRTIFRDKQGTFWLGVLGGGLNMFNPCSRKFTSYQQELNNPYSLHHNVVRAMCEDAYGRLWVGTEGGGLSRFDRESKRFTAFQHDAKQRNSLSHNVVRGMVYDRKRDALWIATGGGGLNRFDLKHGVFTAFRADESNPNALSSDIVRAVLLNDDGTLWVATEGAGLNHFDPTTGRFRTYRNNPNDPRSLSFDVLVSLAKDRTGTLWVGTLRGLNKFDPATNSFTRFEQDITNPHALQSGNIRTMHEDGRGRFWVGTWGGGLHLLDRKTGRCEAFREKDGLPNDAVYGIVEDSTGSLWLTTNNGLARFNPDARTFRVYDADDGLQSNEFNSGAYHHGASGRFYVGGVNGLSEFFPDRITDNTVPPPVVITGFKKFNKRVQLWQDLSAEAIISIPYDDNFFSIEFAALNFTNARKNHYLYKLEGFDKQWIDAGTSREAAYTNLDAGTYTFRVKASNNDGYWNERGTRLRITILPAWWMTLWFRAGLVLCFVGTGGAWFWARWRRVRHQQQELERLVRLRTEQLEDSNVNLSQANAEVEHHIQTVSEQAWEIATINTQLHARNAELERLNTEKNEFLGIAAHDLKNPLSSIVLLAELVQARIDDLEKPQLLEKISRIEATAMRMRDIIADVLDINALESGVLALYPMEFDIRDILHDVVEEYRERAAEKNISLHIAPPQTLDTGVYADFSKTRDVLENILSNAVKYSPFGKQITITITNDQSPIVSAEADLPRASEDVPRLCIAIRDEGPGISDEDMKRLFGKFTRLSAQPTGGEHSTGLGLSIVKKIVEAMNGRVWCESVLGEGATFIVALPKVVREG